MSSVSFFILIRSSCSACCWLKWLAARWEDSGTLRILYWCHKQELCYWHSLGLNHSCFTCWGMPRTCQKTPPNPRRVYKEKGHLPSPSTHGHTDSRQMYHVFCECFAEDDFKKCVVFLFCLCLAAEATQPKKWARPSVQEPVAALKPHIPLLQLA